MNQKNAFQQLLDQDKTIIVDGGLSTQLETQGEDLSSALWSAELLLGKPQAIIDAHIAYLNAGAQIITSASYQASIQGFMSKGLSAPKATEMIASSIELAALAVTSYLQENKFSAQLLIAASVGPYGAFLADGSEYKGDYGISDQALKDFHSQRLAILDQTDADLLACETIPSFQEAQVLSELLAAVQTPAWVSFSCRDGQHINDGTEIEKAVALFEDHPNILAVGVNCTAPQYISEIIDRIKQRSGNKTIVVYPNSGEIYDAKSKTWQSLANPVDFADIAKTWVKQGAKIIGGCCRIGPEQIRKVSATLKSKT